MSAACELGAAAAGGEHRDALARYGHALGMAFQIADDLLDFTQSEAVAGKPTGQDLREHKVTLPLIVAMRELAPAELARVHAFFASPTASDAAIEELSTLIRNHGGLDYARRRAGDYGARAAEALLELPQCEATQALHAAIAYVIGRTH
jgi:octaprenyl-diphosphate synthase